MSESDTDLPKTLIKRIVKRHLSQIDKGDTKRDTQINKDALLAFSEAAKVFINYITATANDVCKESKRQTISVDDIFRALEDTDFVDLIAPLKQSLEGQLQTKCIFIDQVLVFVATSSNTFDARTCLEDYSGDKTIK